MSKTLDVTMDFDSTIIPETNILKAQIEELNSGTEILKQKIEKNENYMNALFALIKDEADNGQKTLDLVKHLQNDIDYLEHKFKILSVCTGLGFAFTAILFIITFIR